VSGQVLVEPLARNRAIAVHDLGRRGVAHLAVPGGGAADRSSLVDANRLVGNPDGAAAFEAAINGAELRFAATAVVAVTGAAAEVELDGRKAPFGDAFPVSAGARLVVGRARSCVRTYIAVRGACRIEPVLGSVSGVGRANLVEPGSDMVGSPIGFDPIASAQRIPGPIGPVEAVEAICVERGPHSTAPDGSDLFAELVATPWVVSPSSNRIGVRLRPAGAVRGLSATGDEGFASFGLPSGAIQLPPGGEPIVMGVDHPTTGGYPVVAVVVADDLDLVGRLRPGQQLRLGG